MKGVADLRAQFRTVVVAVHGAGVLHGDFQQFLVGVRQLRQLADSELTTLSVCDLATGRRRVVGSPGSTLSAAYIAAFDRHFFTHPLVRFHSTHRDGGAHRISDSMGRAEFLRSPLYNEYYRSIGIDHALAVPLYVDDRTLVSFVLNRAGRDFSDDEMAMFDQVRVWLGTMYRNALALRRAAGAIAQLQEIAEGDDWAACNAPTLALSPLVVACPGGQLTVHAMPEMASAASWLLLVRNEPNATIAGAKTSALTAREREVLHWVAAGKTDRQVAAIVGSSHRTVQKHLEHIYTKLGVENRTAAVMRVAGQRLV